MRFFEDPIGYLIGLLYFIPVFLITITVHEVAHAYVAWRLGDPTARAMGRISLNPMRHIDPVGLIMMVVLRFGWAKPVQINPRNFRNEKAGMAISALAGPVSNLLMAFAGVILFHTFLFVFLRNTTEVTSFMYSTIRFFLEFIRWNILFAVFNMLPIPPLDGSRIVNYFLPPHLSRYYEYVERYGFIILMVLLMTGILWGPMGFMQRVIWNGMNSAVGALFNLF